MRNLTENPRPTTELVGVLIHNVRATGSEVDFLDDPISIGNLDQAMLMNMNLIRSIRLSARRTDDEPIATLSNLGLYVVRHAVLIESKDGDGTLPTVDSTSLTKLLS